MNDRELLERAAKAAGINHDKSETNGGGANNDGFDLLGNLVVDWHNNKTWNPLTDDGDALRLAVKLQLNVDPGNDMRDYAWVRTGQHNWSEFREKWGSDQYAATRRAIVRAAAAMAD